MPIPQWTTKTCGGSRNKFSNVIWCDIIAALRYSKVSVECRAARERSEVEVSWYQGELSRVNASIYSFYRVYPGITRRPRVLRETLVLLRSRRCQARRIETGEREEKRDFSFVLFESIYINGTIFRLRAIQKRGWMSERKRRKRELHRSIYHCFSAANSTK